MTKIYVGNVPYRATEEDITALFEQDGREIDDVIIIEDEEEGRPAGFVYVQIEDVLYWETLHIEKNEICFRICQIVLSTGRN